MTKAKGKTAAKAKAPKPKATGPAAPADAAFKTVPGALADDLDSAGAEGKTAGQLRDERADDIGDALFGKEKAKEIEKGEEGPIVTLEDEPEAKADGEDDRWEALALRGAKAGLDAATMTKFDTPEALEGFLNVQEVRLARMFDSRGDANGKDTKIAPPAKAEPEPELEETVGEFKVNEDEYYDAESRQLAEKLARVANTALREVRELRKQVAAQNEQVVGMQNAHAMINFDNAVESELGSDWSPILGDGPTLSLPPDSDAFKNRHELVKMVVRLPAIAEGGESMSFHEAVRRSARGMWSEHVEKMAHGRAADEVAKRRGVMKGRGKSPARSTKPADARDNAVAVAKDFLKTKGLGGSSGEQSQESLARMGF